MTPKEKEIESKETMESNTASYVPRTKKLNLFNWTKSDALASSFS